MNEDQPVRIGVYVCHCGTNIASVIDVKAVVEYAALLPHVVVAREYKYMCSDPGQDMIIKDIQDHNLTRVVVAACSPHLHEETFRGTLKRGGLNPYYFQMANIREQISWVTEDHDLALDKAKAQVTGAVFRVAHHEPLEPTHVTIAPSVLVVGGGIAGIHASLTLANAGKRVYLVERTPTIGGYMAKFDKTFPTLDCAACILTPKMSTVGSHHNIELLTYSEVTNVEGFVGNFTVTVRRKPRYIDEEKCVGCYRCIEACVYKDARFPDEFNEGFGKRKPVYIPFPQAIPLVATIDPETCLYLAKGKCKATCRDACDVDAVVLDQKPEDIQINVGSIIIATGAKAFDATRLPIYGYKRYPNVFTSLEIERMINAAGPTLGKIEMRTGGKPHSIGIIHCIGSRDVNTNRYCSRVCCMYSLKLALLLKEKTGAEITNFYIDMRTPGKMFEEFYERAQADGINFVRGKVGEVSDYAKSEAEQGKLILSVDDTLLGKVRRMPVDMVVLGIGLEPQPDADVVRRMFGMSCSSEGFFLEKHPKLAPVNTLTDGIFLAGSCQGPKDIPDTVAQGGAAAAEALVLIDRGMMELEPITASIIEEFCSGCQLCITNCPYTAISYDKEKSSSVVNEALCKACGTCVATCPSGAAMQKHFTDDQIFAEIEGVTRI